MATELCPTRTDAKAGRLLPAAACLLLLAGCNLGLPQAQTDPTKNYVLSVPATGAVAPTATSAAPVVRLRSVEVPSYLRGRTLVVRRGENEVDFKEFARWGEPLDQGIARVLREELLASGAAGAVQVSGSRVADAADARYELTVRVLACEGVADGTVAFRAVWELAGTGEQHEAAARGDYHPADLRWTPKNEATLAAALSRAVAGLAADIAGALGKK